MWDAGEPTRAHVLVNTPNSRAVWGLIAGQKFDLGGIQLALGDTDHNYAVLIFTSLDGKPLESVASHPADRRRLRGKPGHGLE